MYGDFRSNEILGLLNGFASEPLSEEVQDLYKAARKNMLTNPEEAIELFHKALNNLERSSQIAFDSSEIFAYSRGKIYLLIASIYLNHRNLVEAEANYFYSKEEFHSRQWSHLASLAYLGLAITLRLLGRIREAYDACLEARVNISYESVPSKIDATDLRRAIEKEALEIQELLLAKEFETVTETSTQNYICKIPILSEIAAGPALFAEENIEGYLSLDASYRNKVDFGLRVVGDSMEDDGILSGNVALIRQQQVVETGEIAAIIITTPNFSEGVLKRYYAYEKRREIQHWFLRSSNPSAQHLVVMPSGVNIARISDLYVREIQANKVILYENAQLDIVGKFIEAVQDV